MLSQDKYFKKIIDAKTGKETIVEFTDEELVSYLEKQKIKENE